MTISKTQLVGGAIVLVALIGAGSGIARHTSEPKTTAKSQAIIKQGPDATLYVDACQVLTDTVARQIIGTTARKKDASSSNISTKDISISNCFYTATVDNGKTVDPTRGITLFVRAAATEAGRATIEQEFGIGKTKKSVDVPSYGDAAYFNPELGQLNIRKGGNWYIISNFFGNPLTSSTIESTTNLAKAVTLR